MLDDGDVRCWGFGYDGRLGYGAQADVGDDETPGSVAAVALGGRAVCDQRRRRAHVRGARRRRRALLGRGADGRLGYGATSDVGDDETPASLEPVDLGSGRAALAVQAGQAHTCARLDDGSVRCWGDAGAGRLGYCDSDDIGDDELPGAVLPVDLETPSTRCTTPDPGTGGDGGVPAPPTGAAPRPRCPALPRPSIRWRRRPGARATCVAASHERRAAIAAREPPRGGRASSATAGPPGAYAA